MLSIKCICPYCFNEGFNFAEYLGYIRERKEIQDISYVSTYAVIACCKCKNIFIMFFSIRESLYNQAREAIKNDEMREDISFIEIEKTLPEKEEPPTHECYPKKVNSFLKIVHQSLHWAQFGISDEEREGASVQVVALVRAIMEYVFKNLEIGDEKDTLFTRVNKAFEMGYITKPVAEWGHIVRKWGNKAIHELEVNPAEAKEAYEFLRMLLYLLYRVPYEVQKHKLLPS